MPRSSTLKAQFFPPLYNPHPCRGDVSRDLSLKSQDPEPSTGAGGAWGKQDMEHLWVLCCGLWAASCGLWAAQPRPGGTFPPGQDTPSGLKEQWGHRSGFAQKDPVSPGCFFQQSLPGEIKISESNMMLPCQGRSSLCDHRLYSL